MATTPREQFIDAVQGAPSIWQSIDLRVLAVFAEGEWRNLITRAYLRAAAPRNVRRKRFLPATAHLRAWQLVRPLIECESLIRSQESGVLRADPYDVRFERNPFGGSTVSPIEFSTFLPHLTNEMRISRPYPWAGYLLLATGDGAANVLHRAPNGYNGIESTVRDLPRPFRSIGELATYVTGGTGWAGAGDPTIVEWNAPLEARLDLAATDYRAGVFRYRVVFGSRLALKHTKLFVHEHADDGEDSTRSVAKELGGKIQLPLASLPPNGSEGKLAVSGEREIAGPRRITATLRVGRESVEWQDFTDYRAGQRNARVALYEALDPKTKFLREWLSGDDEQRFEAAVARLFLLAGLQTDRIAGDSRLSDGIDVLAHDPTNACCYAIECTTRSLNANGKIGRLVKRVGELRRAAPDLEVRGILVSAAPRSELAKSELGMAASESLCVLDADGLRSVLELALRYAPLHEVRAMLDQYTGSSTG